MPIISEYDMNPKTSDYFLFPVPPRASEILLGLNKTFAMTNGYCFFRSM